MGSLGGQPVPWLILCYDVGLAEDVAAAATATATVVAVAVAAVASSSRRPVVVVVFLFCFGNACDTPLAAVSRRLVSESPARVQSSNRTLYDYIYV